MWRGVFSESWNENPDAQGIGGAADWSSGKTGCFDAAPRQPD
jgi:hypothetical protein